jgi:hypothetical protein
MLNNLPVPMPTKRIAIKHIKSVAYVYLKSQSYRSDGKIKFSTTLIGKVAPNNSNMLIPNKNYFKLFTEKNITNPVSLKKIEPEPVNNHILGEILKKDEYVISKGYPIPWIHRTVGTTRVLRHFAQQCGLEQILKNVFVDNWHEMLYIAIYMLCEGNVMKGINTWSERVLTNLVLEVDNDRCGYLFSEIKETDRLKFFELWSKFLGDNIIDYDLSSIDCFGDNLEEAEIGRHSAAKGIKQVNIAFLYGHNCKLPISYEPIQGNMPDKKTLFNMINFAKQVNLNNVSFIMDQGFETEENLLYMYKNNFNFIIPLPDSRSINKQWIEIYGKSIANWDNFIPEYNIYGRMFSETIYGIPINIHIYFDAQKLFGADKGMQSAIENLEEKILKEKKISSMEKIPLQYSQYFSLIDNGDGTKSIIRDRNKIEKIRSRHGFFILLTTDENLSSTLTLSSYKQRDIIEKNYYALKSGIDMTKLRTHDDNASKGKLFVAFIALIIRAYLLKIKKESQNKKLKHFSFPDIIRNLSLIDLRVHDGIPDIIGVGPNQTKILEGLQIPPNLFISDYLPTFNKRPIPLKITY